MLIVKGFATNSSLHSNSVGVDNTIGELSTRSMTYTKEKGFYVDRDIDRNISFVGFTVKRGNDLVELPAEFKTPILNVIKEIFAYASSKAMTQLDVQDYLTMIYDKFDKVISDVKFGAIVDDGELWLPERIGFKVLNLEVNDIVIWLSDSSFQRQFPDSEVVVVPPVANIDDFFKKGADVEEFIKTITPTITATKIQEARGKYPETFLRIDMFDYHDPVNPNRVLPTSWGVLVYGISGNNIDSIKNAIIDSILSNSIYTRDEWAKIFPEIFKRNEFVFCPMWDHYAIPNKTTIAGMYSPVIKTVDIVNKLVTVNNDYVETHVTNNASAMGFPYRSLMVGVIGHIENREGKYNIRDVYPDWINTNTTQDFNRMSTATKEFSLILNEAVHLAENFQEHSSMPDGYMKVVRNDKLFLTFSKDGINYLVLCKNGLN